MNKKEEIVRKLKLYEKLLLFLYKFTKSEEKKESILLDISEIASFLDDYFDEETFIRRGILDKINHLENLLRNGFINTILNQKSQIGEIANSSIKIFNEVDTNFDNLPFDYPKLNINDKKEMKDALLSFLNEYDYSFYKKIKNKDILSITSDKNSGVVTGIVTMKKDFVFVNDKIFDNIESIVTMAHEFGHSYENNLFFNNNPYIYNEIFKTPYTEVLSEFFEYAFLNYLIENNLFQSSTKLALCEYIEDMRYYLSNISVISKMDNIKLNDDFYINIDDKEIIDYINSLNSKNPYFVLSDDVINFDEAYLYGIGGLFSIYLYDNYKEDPNNFKKEFKNSILLYPSSKDFTVFERVGITYDELIKGEKLEKVLKRK